MGYCNIISRQQYLRSKICKFRWSILCFYCSFYTLLTASQVRILSFLLINAVCVFNPYCPFEHSAQRTYIYSEYLWEESGGNGKGALLLENKYYMFERAIMQTNHSKSVCCCKGNIMISNKVIAWLIIAVESFFSFSFLAISLCSIFIGGGIHQENWYI